MPIPAATLADLENEGDVRKTLKVRPKGWHFKMYDLTNPEQVKAYEKQRLKLFLGTEDKKLLIAREAVQILLDEKGGQHLYQIVEWMDFDFKIQEHETATQVGLEGKTDEKTSS
jgi:hypothetical protein